MNAADRLYVWLNNGTFIEEKGCSHPLDVIAVSIGCSERTVIRAVKQLECEGRIRVKRSRTRGRANTYWVDCWNPSKRCGVLAVLAGGREEVGRRRTLKRERELSRLARRAECHPKENSRSSRAQTPPVNPSLTASVSNSCGRARQKNEIRTCERCGRTIRLQGGRMADPLRLPVDCDECARKDRIIRQYAENHSKLVEEVSSAHEVARAAGKEVTKLKGQITRRANEDAEADDIRFLLEDWKRDHPKAQIPEGGRRWEIAKKALRLMKDDPAGAKGACSEALEGLRLAPYQRYDKRYALPDVEDSKRVLRNDIEHALGDERRIEACRRIARAVKASPAEKLWWMYEQTAPVSEAYFRLAVDELERPAAVPSERRFEVDGIRVRESGR